MEFVSIEMNHSFLNNIIINGLELLTAYFTHFCFQNVHNF